MGYTILAATPIAINKMGTQYTNTMVVSAFFLTDRITPPIMVTGSSAVKTAEHILDLAYVVCGTGY